MLVRFALSNDDLKMNLMSRLHPQTRHQTRVSVWLLWDEDEPTGLSRHSKPPPHSSVRWRAALKAYRVPERS
jgi:hypothetical protein